MGEWYRHDCPNCDFKAEVSGGDDIGFVAHTSTIVCQDCRSLVDILTGYWKPGIDEIFDPQPLACPKESTHRVKTWFSGDPCPICASPIHRGEATMCWD